MAEQEQATGRGNTPTEPITPAEWLNELPSDPSIFEDTPKTPPSELYSPPASSSESDIDEESDADNEVDGDSEKDTESKKDGESEVDGEVEEDDGSEKDSDSKNDSDMSDEEGGDNFGE